MKAGFLVVCLIIFIIPPGWPRGTSMDRF